MTLFIQGLTVSAGFAMVIGSFGIAAYGAYRTSGYDFRYAVAAVIVAAIGGGLFNYGVWL